MARAASADKGCGKEGRISSPPPRARTHLGRRWNASPRAAIMDSMTSSLSDELLLKRDRLLEVLRGCGRVVVAFSGGIDSTVVAQAAFLALGEQAVAITADSASVARREID